MKHFSILLFFFLLTLGATAQYCGNSGPSVCTPVAAPDTSYRVWPTSYMHDCIIRDSFYSTSFTIYNTSSVVQNQWLRIDSINNLPCGFCFSTNKTNNTVNYGDSMCVLISGTTHTMPGQYNARMVLTANIGINITTAVTGHNSQYWLPLRIQDDQGICPEVDTFSNGSFVNCNNVGIEEESITQVKAAFIGDKLIVTNIYSPCTLQLFNLQGQQMLQNSVTSAYTQACPQLPAGIYIAVLTNASGASRVIRLVKAG